MARAKIIDGEAEAPPEADQLDGWPHPRETRRLFGHGPAEALLTDAIGSHRLHHAWLLTGEQGIGKASFAYCLARFLLTQEETLPENVPSLDIPEDHRSHRQIAHRAHPGLIVVKRAWDASGKKFRQSIAIDDIRALRHFLQRTAVTPWRCVIVDSADDLNLNSANALLKSLEEPPPRTVFLLISSSPGRLLPTIRSRCRTVRFAPLDSRDLAQAVLDACRLSERDLPEEAQLQRLLSVGNGSVRRVLELIDGGGIALFDALAAILESLPAMDRGALLRFAALAGGRDANAYNIGFELLEDIIADILRSQAGGGTEGRFAQFRRFASLINTENLAEWAELWETIREARGEAERLNLDKTALTLTIFEKIARLARRAKSRP